MSLLDELIQYSNDIISGAIVACQKHKWACVRFLLDLGRRGTDDFPWVFDQEKADRYLDWMRLFKHRKGPLIGQKKEPVPYEMFVYGNIYGWVHKDTGLRRFRRSYEQLGRKNAKSQDKAIQTLYEISAFGEQSAEAYVAATKKADTRHVWGEASWLYKNSELLKDKFVTKFDQELMQVAIRHKKSDSFFSRLSKDDKKTGDGTNPQFVVLDEYHLHETTEYYDLASSGMKTRLQPLLSIITTAGFELNNPCYRVEYDYVSKILDPNNPIENDRYFVMICEVDTDENGTPVDDIRSEAARLKSNPIIGNTAVGIESINYDILEALDKPEKMRDLLTKTFNIWINQRTAGYMNMEKWAACGATKDRPFPDVAGKNVIPGVDLSAVLDLTSVTFDIPLEDSGYAILSHSFMPEDTLAAKRKTDKVDYDRWVREGWITATPEAEVDYHYVLDYILEQYEKYKWPKGEIAFDQAMATWLAHEVEERGFTPVAIPQYYSGLSEATKDFRAKVYSKKIFHDNNPVLTWAMGNAVVRKSPNESIMLNKSKSTQRIDPAAATLTAHARAMVNEKPKRSIYEDPDRKVFAF
ncbi:MAG: terminase TerL endonuclease subunit [Eubacteriales bacterium]|jgi:phage terminase large subunit-like protein